MLSQLSQGLDLEEVPCALCGARETQPRERARDRLLGLPGQFQIVRCRHCGLAYLNPRPTSKSLRHYYPVHYYPLDEQPSRLALGIAQGVFQRVARLRTTGRVLDVGCGTGLLLSLFHEAGWEGVGVETDPNAIAYARRVYGLTICEGDLPSASFQSQWFDVVVLWGVLEHLSNPIVILKEIRRILKVDGWVLMGLPNYGSFERQLFGRRWYSLDAPRHLYHFTPQTLKLAIDKAGLTLQRLVHSPGTVGFAESIIGDLTGLSLKMRGRDFSPATHEALARMLGQALRPVCWILAALGSGGALEIYAQPDLTGDVSKGA